ncbi:nuclear transport factor 2 family protein [Amycolatopsis sp. NEAU-NG30]|uniref:Nuclear transport factor 2 family protein n=1 Tax=Amycolatopsis melonis TaxID=3156488 RepID=A0ABV0L820_9PSEU
MTSTTTSTTSAVAGQYLSAMAAKDFAALGSLFAEDIVWHQPGNNRFSGTLVGVPAVQEMIAAQMAFTQGTFDLVTTGAPMINGDMFAVPVHFSAKHGDSEISMDGFDVHRVSDGRIAEVWLFSDLQQGEDSFWDAE